MSWRPAVAADAEALRDLEEAANRVALAHVFVDSGPFPRAEVLARWRETLAEPGVRVDVLDRPGPTGGLACYAAYDATTLRHLAVHPDRWGEGLARVAVERAAAAIRAGGGRPRLWCLVVNTRAQGLYAHLGWVPSGVETTSEWPPHPRQVELVLPTDQPPSRGGGLGDSGA